MRSYFKRKVKTSGLGLDQMAGDEHYRAYVGPPEQYDLVSAMVFNLLTSIGLRQHHKVLDIGCGSLRVGRLLIPYLNIHNYVGVEPNKWLVTDGIENEIGNAQIGLKKPIFSYSDSMQEFKKCLNLDYAIAQSIFSHCGLDLIENWLSQLVFHFKDNGALIATFLESDEDYGGQGWVYPGCVSYRLETLEKIALKYNYKFTVLNWAHPRQTWSIISRPNYDTSLIEDGEVSWNKLVYKIANRVKI